MQSSQHSGYAEGLKSTFQLKKKQDKERRDEENL